MMLAFVSGLGAEKNEIDLCLVADKPDWLSIPVRIRELRPTFAAVHRVGAEEAVTVSAGDDPHSVIIEVNAGGSIYLTPNLSQNPGMKVRKIKVSIEGGAFRTFYEKERAGWEEWVANRQRT